MKTYITTNPNTPTGYEVTVKHDDGKVEHLPIIKKEPDRETKGAFDWYILPENPANRKMVNGKKIHDGMELSYRETRTQSSSTSTTPKASTKGWTEYLTDEERALYEELKVKAERRAQIAKLKAQKAEWERQLAELEAQE
jgi:hypothetical protein